MTYLIEARGLHKTFGDTQAVKELSLRVAAGEIYGLVGPDGAGKTTTIRLLCAALRPDRSPAGSESVIRIAGFDLLRQTEQARAQIGYLPQRFSLYDDLTVLENIRFFAEVRGLAESDWLPRCMEILRFVGLGEFVGRRAGHLSGGMKQKLGLAAALVHRPKVLLLDEPTTGVDPVTRQDFWRLIIRLVGQDEKNGIAVLVSTPYMDEAARCHRLGFLRNGRMQLEGTPTEICGRLQGQILELRGRPLPLLRRLSREEAAVEAVQMFGDRLHLRLQPGAGEAVKERLSRRILAEGGELDFLDFTPPQLEDVFIALAEANDG